MTGLNLYNTAFQKTPKFNQYICTVFSLIYLESNKEMRKLQPWNCPREEAAIAFSHLKQIAGILLGIFNSFTEQI